MEPDEPLGYCVRIDAAATERARIVALIRRRAAENKGMAWFHPQFDLEQLAKEIEDLK